MQGGSDASGPVFTEGGVVAWWRGGGGFGPWWWGRWWRRGWAVRVVDVGGVGDDRACGVGVRRDLLGEVEIADGDVLCCGLCMRRMRGLL